MQGLLLHTAKDLCHVFLWGLKFKLEYCSPVKLAVCGRKCGVILRLKNLSLSKFVCFAKTEWQLKAKGKYRVTQKNGNF